MITTRHPRALHAGQYAALACYMIFLAIPLFWLLSVSFKGPRELVELHPSFVPTHPTLDNYRHIFFLTTANATGAGTTTMTTDFPRYFLNSIVIGALAEFFADLLQFVVLVATIHADFPNFTCLLMDHYVGRS